MGLMSWIRGSRRSKPRPPWVRPEFLGLFALVLAAGIGISYWSGGASQDPTPVAQQERRAYVGVDPFDLAGPLPCELACHVEELWLAWQRDHPGAQVIRRSPVYHHDLLIGYDVVYREPA